MGVQGYLSLYTMLLGWQQYDSLWSIMVATGIFYIPFLYIVVKGWLQPLLSQETKAAAVISVRRIIIGLIGGLALLCVAGLPTVQLQPNAIHFQPSCDGTAKIATPGNSGTTYDNLPVPSTVTIPLLWYVVLAVSNGVTDAAISGLSCVPVDLRNLQNQIDLSTIQDAQLKAETKEFYQQCYLPAYSQYMAATNNPALQNQIDKAKDKFGQDDVSWIGSNTFNTVDGFYNRIQSSNMIAGFPFSPLRDVIEGQMVPHPKWGEPYCNEWWADSSDGLRVRLYNQLAPTAQAQITKLAQTFPQGGAALQDAVIKSLLQKSFLTMGFIDRGYDSEEDNRAGLADKAAMVAAKVFTVKAALMEYPKLHILLNALPVLQAVLLFGIFVLLAFALPLSGYSIGFCFTASVMLFSVTFCSYIWHVVSWFDAWLLQSLYGAPAGGTPQATWAANLLTNTISPGRILADLTISSAYIFLPFVWLAMTAWAGVKGGAALSSLEAGGISSAANQVGKSTSGLIGK